MLVVGRKVAGDRLSYRWLPPKPPVKLYDTEPWLVSRWRFCDSLAGNDKGSVALSLLAQNAFFRENSWLSEQDEWHVMDPKNHSRPVLSSKFFASGFSMGVRAIMEVRRSRGNETRIRTCFFP